jgi:hypothetical protein
LEDDDPVSYSPWKGTVFSPKGNVRVYNQFMIVVDSVIDYFENNERKITIEEYVIRNYEFPTIRFGYVDFLGNVSFGFGRRLYMDSCNQANFLREIKKIYETHHAAADVPDGTAIGRARS